MQKAIHFLPSAAFVSLTFCVFGPLQLFFTNISEFWFSLNDIWWLCILCGIVATALLTGAGMLFPKKLQQGYVCLLFGIGLALYIQGNYVPTNYGSLNGETVDWGSFSGSFCLNGLMWIGCIIVPFFLKKIVKDKHKLTQIINYLSTAIITVQLISVGVLFVVSNHSGESRNTEYSLTTEGEYKLSRENNTIIFVLDCYDSKTFRSFIEKYPDYKNTLFADFSYYPNTVGGATRTVVAMPYILTGYPYIHEEPYSEYIDNGFKSTSLYKQLGNAGYTVGLYTNAAYVSPNAAPYIMNFSTNGKAVGSYLLLANRLLQFTACRYFPLILKPYVWMYSGDFDDAAENKMSYVTDDAAFYRNLLSTGLEVDSSDGAFRLYHLNGAHAPYTLDSYGSRQKETSAEEQQVGLMCILNEFFLQMKRLGIYDSANIVIMSDHGEGGIEYNPVLLIKDSTSKVSTYTVNKTPVSYQNLQPTFQEWIGTNDTGKTAIKDLTADDNKNRCFYRQVSDGSKSYLVEYRITNTVQVDEEVEEVARYQIMTAKRGEGLRMGEVVYYDATASGAAYIVSGFRETETTHTWTLGESAEMLFPLQEVPKDDVLIKIDLYSQITAYQRVFAEANGNKLGCYLVTDKQMNVRVPKSMISMPEIAIKLSFLDAARPCDINPASTDSSLLSLAFYSVCIDKCDEGCRETEKLAVPQLDQNAVISFSSGGNCTSYLLYGWHDQELEHRWATQEAKLSADWDAAKDYTMQINGWTYGPSGSVDVYFNGKLVATLEGNQFDPIALPASMAEESGIQTIEFIAPNAVSPKQAGKSEDGRTLGIAIRSIEFTEAE